MADVAQLEAALVKADAAGNAEDARAIAGEIRKLRIGGLRTEGRSQLQPPTPFQSSGETAITGAEEIAANPYTRFAIGAAKPILGAGQLAANAVGAGAPVNQHLKELNDITQKGRQYIGSRGFDAFEGAGQVASPVNLAAAGAMPATASAGGRIAQGAAMGALAGTTEPVTDPNNYWSQKGVQIGTGAALGSVLPAGWELAKGMGRAARNVAQPYMGQWGADQAAGRLANTAANGNADPIIHQLQQPQTIVQGSRPTAAQAAAPANSAEFSALEQLAAERKPSQFYGPLGIEGDQGKARAAALRGVAGTPADIASAESARAAATKPMRTAALDAANTVGVSTDTLLRQIRGVESQPGIRASDVVTKSLSKVKEKIAEFTNADGFINAKDLYTIRKEIGNIIEQNVQETKNWDKRLTGGLQRDLQKNIDEAIEAAGGKGWKDYLSTYSNMSKPIEQMQVGQQLESKLVAPISDDARQRAHVYANALRETGDLSQTFTPRQASTLEAVQKDLARDALVKELAKKGMPSARDRIGQAVPEAPPSGMFSPIISVARGAYNRLTGHATDKIMEDLSSLMQNPQEMARVMQSAKPFERKALIDAMMKYQGVAAENAVAQETR